MSELTVNQVDVAKLAVGPGEILMVTVDRPITREQAERIGAAFRRAFKLSGNSIPEILVVDQMEVKVVRKEDQP